MADTRETAGALVGSDDAPFVLRHPPGWEPAGDQLPAGDEDLVAALRRTDGRGFVTVAVRGQLLGTTLDEVQDTLLMGLEDAFSDFELVRCQPIRIPAGTAIYTSYVLVDSGRVQSNLTVAVGPRTYQLDAALPATADDVAEEVAAMFASFEVRNAAG
jgi:hypothetical protein